MCGQNHFPTIFNFKNRLQWETSHSSKGPNQPPHQSQPTVSQYWIYHRLSVLDLFNSREPILAKLPSHALWAKENNKPTNPFYRIQTGQNQNPFNTCFYLLYQVPLFYFFLSLFFSLFSIFAFSFPSTTPNISLQWLFDFLILLCFMGHVWYFCAWFWFNLI